MQVPCGGCLYEIEMSLLRGDLSVFEYVTGSGWCERLVEGGISAAIMASKAGGSSRY